MKKGAHSLGGSLHAPLTPPESPQLSTTDSELASPSFSPSLPPSPSDEKERRLSPPHTELEAPPCPPLASPYHVFSSALPYSWSYSSASSSSTSAPTDSVSSRTIFSHTSTSSASSTIATITATLPVNFYISLPSAAFLWTRHSIAGRQVHGTYDLGRGRRGAISGPSSGYYEGLCETGKVELEELDKTNGESERSDEEDGSADTASEEGAG